MSGGIYLLQDGGGLVEMAETAYDSEALLQELLATYPSLLAGDQINSAVPRRWLLISREVGLASEEGGSARWSVDHVFLDQDAVPTLVEVKRSTDTRIRREVVGQMLDYAANAVVYWPIESMQAQFERTCSDDERDPADRLAELLGDGADPDDFWQQAKTNLQAGRIRMVFVADQIPAELQRIVEFLNGQMDPAEVLAVEVRQFVGQGQRAMVPRVLGQTATALQKKASAGPRESRQWDEATFFEALEARHGHEVAAAGRAIYQWAQLRGLRVWWGKGRDHGSLYPMLDHGTRSHWLVTIWTYARVQVQFGEMKKVEPFNEPARRQELLERLNAIDRVVIPPDGIERWPAFPLTALSDPDAMRQFLGTLDWYIEQIRVS